MNERKPFQEPHNPTTLNCLGIFLMKGVLHFKLHGFIPCDDERELLSAGFDPVLSLHVRHELCAVTIDGQDDVPRTKVALGGFAAWCYLQVAFIHSNTHMHTENPYTATGERKKRKKELL